MLFEKSFSFFLLPSFLSSLSIHIFSILNHFSISSSNILKKLSFVVTLDILHHRLCLFLHDSVLSKLSSSHNLRHRKSKLHLVQNVILEKCIQRSCKMFCVPINLIHSSFLVLLLSYLLLFFIFPVEKS